jgi:hypothetical protein
VPNPVILALVGCTVAFLFVVLVGLEGDGDRAARRADLLVREVLSAAELAELDERGYLEVPSRTWPARRYRVPAWPGWVIVVEDGRAVSWLCLRPTRALPPRELVVVHKLMLEGAEQEYLRLANRVP